MKTIPWWQTAVFYQIYPRSFKDSGNDGIGDIPGIISKLDYLVSLGIDALWISPFFKSPMDDFGYDISDYCDIDRIFGTMQDVTLLIEEIHKRGLKVIFDLVINHTSDQHPWFVEARSSPDNPKHDWYIWQPRTDRETGKPRPKPNNWIGMFELTNAWRDNDATDEWFLGTFTQHQPEVNWRNPDLKNAMYDVIRFWLDLHVDGFRMDVVNWYIKDEKLRSNPFSWRVNPDIFQKHIYDRNQPETHDICREIRGLTDSYDGSRVLVGEIFVRDVEIAASYQGNGNDELHLAFNMEMLYIRWSARVFAKTIARWYAALPGSGWPNFTFSNHDQPRHATRFGVRNEDHQLARMQIIAMLLLTLRGTPFMYYGEEIGMKNVRVPHSEMSDPSGKTFWPLPLGRDGQRTPMQWSSAENAGFTESGVLPWLPIHKNYREVNAEKQQADPGSLWHWYRKLLAIRKTHEELRTGRFSFIKKGKNSVLAFRRAGETGLIECYLNFSNRKKRVGLPVDVQVVLGNFRGEQEKLPAGRLELAPYEALLVKI
ncbi:alpha-glucosidase [Brucepastera parasyntrophica]|uniref:alpha-glucosidase n=1 Tax=Brucepastera parasyntrophica TaxID=2880008 RepID=UPI00210D4B2E|nr:alpha-glucosidase [Brucepastera parasyntrophica]ULQ58701.1 alpha-glucosidase [Brucepastera parasyntrophica]